MPLNIIGSMLLDGPDVLPGWQYILKYGPPLAVAGSLKYYFRGTTNTWERDLHGKVYMVTGGTAGLGAAVVDDLARRGAQVIILVRSIDDFWTQDYVTDLRETHQNFMIYAEECDLASLYSIRKFATKWLDNVPPRRLDGIICCAGEALPYGKERENSEDGIEIQTAVNYVGHYHLLTLLSPSLRAQLADRDVRVILTTCHSQSLGEVDLEDPLFQNKRYPKNAPWKVYGTSKLQLGLFAREFQRRILAQERKDGQPCMVRVNVVNPGMMRSPSTKRVLTFGSLLGLLFYLFMWPLLWIVLKSPLRGAQSMFFALMSPDLEIMDGGNFINECSFYEPPKKDYSDLELQKKLFDSTEAAIAVVEKESAIRRKKKEQEEEKKNKKKSGDPKTKENTNKVGIDSTTTEDEVPLFPGMEGLKGKFAHKEKEAVKTTSAAKADTKVKKTTASKNRKKSKKT